VSNGIGLDGEDIVPTEDEMKQQQAAAMSQAAAQGLPGHAMGPPGPPPKGGGPPPGHPPQGHPGNPPPRSGGQMGPQANVVGPRVAGGVG
jgi:hypothetical protein